MKPVGGWVMCTERRWKCSKGRTEKVCECGTGLENQPKQEILTEEADVAICQYQKESHHIVCSFPLVVLKSTDPNSPPTANKLPTDYEIKWLSKLKVPLKFLKPWLMFGFFKFPSKCKSFYFVPQLLSCYNRQIVFFHPHDKFFNHYFYCKGGDGDGDGGCSSNSRWLCITFYNSLGVLLNHLMLIGLLLLFCFSGTSTLLF